MATLELTGVELSKDGRRILDGVDLSVANGELVALVGASGSGKTTLLRVAAGLDVPDAGEVRLGGRLVEGDISDRNVAMVFQNSVLYPLRDVARNVSFPLEMQHRSAAEISERVLAEGRALHLTEMLDRNPRELSAGHQQLVQIARALVRAPDLFLMDEPLARLDSRLRLEMRSELRMVQRGYGVTTLYVTNDPLEAMAVADRLGVLVDGRLVQLGAPTDVYAEPVSRTVAELTGDLDIVAAAVTTDDGGSWLEHDAFRVRAWAPALRPYAGIDVAVGFRPEHLALSDSGARATVEAVSLHGPFELVECRLGGDLVHVRSKHVAVGRGDVVWLDVVAGHVFDPVDGRTIASWR